MIKIFYFILLFSFACAPYESVGDFKTVLLERGDSIIEVGSAMGTHDRFDSKYHFVFRITGEGDSIICQIVVLELPDSSLELIEVPINGEIDKEIWSDYSFHVSRIPELGWSARLINAFP